MWGIDLHFRPFVQPGYQSKYYTRTLYKLNFVSVVRLMLFTCQAARELLTKPPFFPEPIQLRYKAK